MDERKPSIYIGKQPFYINFYGVDRATGKVVTGPTEKPDNTNIQDRVDRFAARLGYVPEVK